MLEGVKQADFDAYKTQFAAKAQEKEANEKLIKPTEEIELFYSAKL